MTVDSFRSKNGEETNQRIQSQRVVLYESIPDRDIQLTNIIQLLQQDQEGDDFVVLGDWLREYCSYISMDIDLFSNDQPNESGFEENHLNKQELIHQMLESL